MVLAPTSRTTPSENEGPEKFADMCHVTSRGIRQDSLRRSTGFEFGFEGGVIGSCSMIVMDSEWEIVNVGPLYSIK